MGYIKLVNNILMNSKNERRDDEMSQNSQNSSQKVIINQIPVYLYPIPIFAHPFYSCQHHLPNQIHIQNISMGNLPVTNGVYSCKSISLKNS